MIDPEDFELFDDFTTKLHQRLKGEAKYQLFTNDDKPYVIVKLEKKAGIQ